MPVSVERLLSRVDAEIHDDRVWRAKELLGGAIGSGVVDAPVLERYGQLLDSVGDRVEAGKYLFLSGARRPEYAPCIQLFLDRHGRSGPKNLFARFPARVRCRPANALPPHVVAELEALGVTAGFFSTPRARVNRQLGRWQARAIFAAVIVAVVAFIVGTLVGIRAILGWLQRWLG